MNPEVDLILYGGTIITQDEHHRVIKDGAIAIRSDTLMDIGISSEIFSRYSSKKVIPTQGKYIFPGLINTHTHLFQTFMKGLGEGLPLYRWLNAVTAPSTIAMTRRDAYLAAVLGLMDSIHSGTTTVLDYMYALPQPDLYFDVAQAYQDVHIRGILGWGLLETGDQHGLAPSMFRPVAAALDDLDGFARQVQHELLTLALAPGITFGITKQGFQLIRDYAKAHSLLITLHINETDDDNRASELDCRQSTVELLEEVGILGPNLLAVHCVKMTDREIETFRKYGTKISHNPVSNMYLGSGVAPIQKMRHAGIQVSLASDGAASNNTQDMLEVLKCTGLMHKLDHQDPSAINAKVVLDLATCEAARTVGMSDQIGSLEVGKKADLFIFNPTCAKAVPTLDPVASLVFSSSQECIETVIVGGQEVLVDGRIARIDEKLLLQECQEAAMQLTERSGTKSLIVN
jgi:5-methylthioadenosine/S-adenosylhomocysteine deaminase